jgi:hypothetical protein
MDSGIGTRDPGFRDPFPSQYTIPLIPTAVSHFGAIFPPVLAYGTVVVCKSNTRVLGGRRQACAWLKKDQGNSFIYDGPCGAPCQKNEAVRTTRPPLSHQRRRPIVLNAYRSRRFRRPPLVGNVDQAIAVVVVFGPRERKRKEEGAATSSFSTSIGIRRRPTSSGRVVPPPPPLDAARVDDANVVVDASANGRLSSSLPPPI